MSTWHIDYINGTDTTNDGKGWWKVAYTVGNGTQPVADETATGGTSGSTAKVISVVVSSGTWAGGDAAGTIYWYGKSAAFVAETLTFAVGLATCAIAADFSVSSVKTINGVTAAMSAPGDTMKLAKSTDPVSMGNATWTNDSATVTLAAAQTITVDACDGATGDWVASANVTETKETTVYKEGTGARKFVVATAFTTGIIAYKDLATLDLSTKQKITFWIRSSVQLAANTLQLDLCSDNVGAEPVNSFTIPYILYADRWCPLTFSPNAGAGNLGNAIESVSLVVLIADIAATGIYLDNIEASPTNGLNLQSWIGKNTGWPETFWCLKSILGTTVILGESQQHTTDVTKYYGTTELVATYNRETIKTTLVAAAGTAVQYPMESGTTAAHMNYIGGYDTATNARNGETWFDGTMGWGHGIGVSGISYCDFSYIGLVRYYADCNMYGNIDGIYETMHLNGASSTGFYGQESSQYRITVNNICCVQNIVLGFQSILDGNSINNLAVISNGSGVDFGGSSNTIFNLIAKGNNYNISKAVGRPGVKNRIYTATLSNAITSDFYIQRFGMEILCENVEMLSTTEITASTTVSSYYGTIVASQKHDKTKGLHKTYVMYDGLGAGVFYTIVIDTVIPGGGAFSTRVVPGNTATQKTEATCLIEPVADAGNLTVSVDVRESVVGDGTDYNGGRIELVAKKNVAIGIAADTVIATATVASEGAFETISGSLTGASLTITDNGAVEFVVRCQGTAASTGWINFDNAVPS